MLLARPDCDQTAVTCDDFNAAACRLAEMMGFELEDGCRFLDRHLK